VNNSSNAVVQQTVHQASLSQW